MGLYRGFSTVNRARKFRVTDRELIKQDLFNHLHIKKGEKLMNPNFGTIIWNVLFEPFTDSLKQAIGDDIKAIAAYDPRLSIDNVYITEYMHGIQLELELRYVSSDETENLVLQFDREAKKVNLIA